MGWTIQRILLTALFCFSLSACFASEDPLIPQGSGVLPIDGGAWIGNSDYSYAEVSADGYFFKDEPMQDEPARFLQLLIENGVQYFLVEFPTGEGGYFHGVARRTTLSDKGVSAIQIAMVKCSDLPQSLHQEMIADGWQISDDKGGTCMPPSLEALTSLFRSVLTAEILESEEWWEQQGG